MKIALLAFFLATGISAGKITERAEKPLDEDRSSHGRTWRLGSELPTMLN
jgi:hypothetical protein